MIVVGLTGSIGMGKSTAARLLSGLGIPVHSADEAVHKLLGPGGKAVKPVSRMFPGVVRETLSGKEIDRQALGRVVFGHPEKLKRLEEILHPLVRADSDDFIEQSRKNGAEFVVLDIPLLFETGGENRVDYVVCVTAPFDVQKSRVLARDGMTEEKFNAIIKEQMPDAEKRRRADFVVHSDVSEQATLAELKNILDDIRMRENSAPKNGSGYNQKTKPGRPPNL